MTNLTEGSSRTARVSSVSAAFIATVKRAFIARTLSPSVGTLSEREAEAAFLKALSKAVERAALKPGAMLGACDLIELRGESLMVLRIADGVAVALSLNSAHAPTSVDQSSLLDAFDNFTAGRKTEANGHANGHATMLNGRPHLYR